MDEPMHANKCGFQDVTRPDLSEILDGNNMKPPFHRHYFLIFLSFPFSVSIIA